MATFSDRYSLGKVLSQTWFGSTYACSNRTGHTFAVTLVRLDHLSAHAQRRFADERAKIVSAESPNLLRVRDMLSSDGVIAIVTDPHAGPTLAEALDNDRLPAAALVQIAAAVARALQALHSEQIVHRAVRPEVILIDQGFGSARLTDFGLSWLSDEELMRPGSDADSDVVAARYRAPEVGQRKRVTAAADVYSLGVLVYETLTGQLVPAGRDARRAMRDRDRVLDELPAGLRRLIIGMLDDDPGRRPTSAVCAATLTALVPKMSAAASVGLPRLRTDAVQVSPLLPASRPPLPVAPLPVAPLPVAPLPVAPLPVAPLSSQPAVPPRVVARPAPAASSGSGLMTPDRELVSTGSNALGAADPELRVSSRALWPLAIGLFTLAVTAFVILRTGSGLHPGAQGQHSTYPATSASTGGTDQRPGSSGSAPSGSADPGLGHVVAAAGHVTSASRAFGHDVGRSAGTSLALSEAGATSLLAGSGATSSAGSAATTEAGQTKPGQTEPGQTVATNATPITTTAANTAPGRTTPIQSGPGNSTSGAAASTQPSSNVAVQAPQPGTASGSEPEPSAASSQSSTSQPAPASSQPVVTTGSSQPTASASTSSTPPPSPSPPSITTAALGSATVGVPYSTQVIAIDPAIITWSITSGSLPDGLSLDPSSGEISGTPTTAGSYDFVIQALDELSESSVAALEITVYPAVAG